MKKTPSSNRDIPFNIWCQSLYMTLPDSEQPQMTDYSQWYHRWEDVLYSIYHEDSLIKQQNHEKNSQLS